MRTRRLMDMFPARHADPLDNVRDYIDRRSAAFDPIRDQRQRRNFSRQPHVDPGSPIISVHKIPTTASTMEEGRIYRVRGTGGAADSFKVRAKNAAGNYVVATITIT